jgi:hypothetical protein
MHTYCTAPRSQEVLHLRLAHSRVRTRAAYLVPSCLNPARSASAPGRNVLSTCVRAQVKAKKAEERKSERKNADCACLRACRRSRDHSCHPRQTGGRRATRAARHPDGVKHVYHARHEDWLLRARPSSTPTARTVSIYAAHDAGAAHPDRVRVTVHTIEDELVAAPADAGARKLLRQRPATPAC